jgi:TonB-dependent starch-binding outer membrane protein SusC
MHRNLPFHLSVIFTLAVMLSCQTLFAQGTIKGSVRASGGEGLAGTAVMIEGLQIGAFADESGNFSIPDVPAGSAIVVAQMYGYKTAKKAVTVANGQTVTVNFSMQDSISSTDEVVVVGYGVQRQRDLVGAVGKVNGDQLRDNVGVSVETQMQGKLSGLQIIQGSGGAGSGSIIRIRGIGSVSSGGDPLYVVDGIPITQDNFINGASQSGLDGLYPNVNNNPLTTINPNDIESIEVLKDASAASIYGSRGANGVILITTKKGKKERAEFKYNATFGIVGPTVLPKMLNTDQLLKVRQEAWENDGNVGRAPLPNVFAQAGYTYADAESTNHDWYKDVIRTGVKHEHSLSYSQSKKYFTNYVGVTYLNSQSYMVGNGLDRLSGRWNFDIKPMKNLTFSVNSSLAQSWIDRVRQEYGSPLGLAMSYALPFYPVYMPDGKTYFNKGQNPLAVLNLQKWKSRETRTINSFKTTYSPIKNLTFNVTGNMDYMKYGDYIFEDSAWTVGSDIAKYFGSRTVNWSTYATGQYDIEVPNKNHKMSLMLGTEYQSSRTDISRLKLAEKTITGLEKFALYDFNSLKNLDTANNVRLINGAAGDYIKMGDSLSLNDRYLFASVFARFNYKFKDRWILQATYRRDGSSKFGANSRFGNFPSVGLGYVMSEESFLKNSKVVNFLKLKASWGLTGNSNINWRSQFPMYSNDPSVYNGSGVLYQTQFANPNLQWEVSRTYDAGFELGLFKDRINMDFAYYYRRTSKALIQTFIQASSGPISDVVLQNVGVIDNYGIEFSINTVNVTSRNFRWKTNFNITRNNNIVRSVGSATPDALDGGFGDMRTVVGSPVSTNYIIRFDHVDEATGKPVYLDKDGKETFTYDPAVNRVSAGAGIPKFLGGITNTFNYKALDFSFLWVFSYGGKVYDDAGKRTYGVINLQDDVWNYTTEVLDRWRQPGDVAPIPKFTTTMRNWGGSENQWQNNSTLFLKDASYIRLRNVQLGYNMPVPENSKIKAMRFTLTGNNLVLFTNYYADPEVARGVPSAQQRNIGSANNSFLTPPQERSLLIGLNATF